MDGEGPPTKKEVVVWDYDPERYTITFQAAGEEWREKIERYGELMEPARPHRPRTLFLNRCYDLFEVLAWLDPDYPYEVNDD